MKLKAENKQNFSTNFNPPQQAFFQLEKCAAEIPI